MPAPPPVHTPLPPCHHCTAWRARHTGRPTPARSSVAGRNDSPAAAAAAASGATPPRCGGGSQPLRTRPGMGGSDAPDLTPYSVVQPTASCSGSVAHAGRIWRAAARSQIGRGARRGYCRRRRRFACPRFFPLFLGRPVGRDDRNVRAIGHHRRPQVGSWTCHWLDRTGV